MGLLKIWLCVWTCQGTLRAALSDYPLACSPGISSAGSCVVDGGVEDLSALMVESPFFFQLFLSSGNGDPQEAQFLGCFHQTTESRDIRSGPRDDAGL